MIPTIHRVYFGDSRKCEKIFDESVQLIVTSPPYFNLKDYGSDNQIGFGETYEEYINSLKSVFTECMRVLSPGCKLCVNIGDTYTVGKDFGRYMVYPIHSDIIKICKDLGFDYMNSIIWQKTSTMNTSGGGSVMGSFPYPRNGIVEQDYEYILLFKKLGNSPQVSDEQKMQSKMTTQEWRTFFAGHWNINGIHQDVHPAMFPVEIPYRLIKMFSFVGETVFDPFMGSGTTMQAAKALCRNSIGCELNHAYESVIKSKFGSKLSNDMLGAKLEFID